MKSEPEPESTLDFSYGSTQKRPAPQLWSEACAQVLAAAGQAIGLFITTHPLLQEGWGRGGGGLYSDPISDVTTLQGAEPRLFQKQMGITKNNTYVKK